MKHLKQLSLIFVFCILGNLLSLFTMGKLPGNIIGMMLLFASLCFGIVKLCHIEDACDFFLKNMAFFFIPASLGILETYGLIKDSIVKILIICFITTFLTALTTALTVHIIVKFRKKV